MELLDIYKKVGEVLDRIDYNHIWKGFSKREYALYNKQFVVLNGRIFDKTDEFYANTSIWYEGRYIAIWKMDKHYEQSIEELYLLVSKVVHEMFHAYQGEQKEQRYANELEALYKYQYEPEYIQMRYEENLLLTELIRSFNTDSYQKFLQIRRDRKNRYPYEYQYDSSIEAIEGTASYVELMVLKQLTISSYHAKLKQWMEIICDYKALIPARIMGYYSGALFLYLCQIQQIEIDRKIENQLNYYGDDLLDHIIPSNRQYVIHDRIREYINADVEELEQKIEQVLLKHKNILETRVQLTGVNVYSARHRRGYILTYYFLSYRMDDKEVIRYGDYILRGEDGDVIELYEM